MRRANIYVYAHLSAFSARMRVGFFNIFVTRLIVKIIKINRLKMGKGFSFVSLLVFVLFYFADVLIYKKISVPFPKLDIRVSRHCFLMWNALKRVYRPISALVGGI